MSKDEIILSMETAIRGGSISILRGRREIDFWTGEGEVSKSDEVLHQISILLKKNNIEKREIRLVALSTGPGSFTGLRIGFALARGLRRSLGCSIKGVSVLEALMLKANTAGNILTAIPIGNNQVYWQIFRTKGEKKSIINSVRISTEDQFLIELISNANKENQENFVLVSHRYLYSKLKDFFSEQTELSFQVKTETNLAKYVGLSVSKREDKNASDKVNLDKGLLYLPKNK